MSAHRLPLLFLALAAAASAQVSSPQVELDNLHEDVQGLIQRVNDLSLRVEQLEHENAELARRAGTADKDYATVEQLNAAVADLNRTVQAAIASSRDAILQRVGTQMEKLARQTNAALDSVQRGQAPAAPAAAAPAAPAPAAASYPQEGESYTVQRGDTLELIAKKTHAKLADIIHANKIADPSRIQTGQTLFIPGGK